MTHAARIFMAIILVGLLAVTISYSNAGSPHEPETAMASAPDQLSPAQLKSLRVRYQSLSARLSKLKPSQPYILVDTARNHLYIKRQGNVVLDALASTGSGTILDKPGESNDQWIFDTPRGEFRVQSKLTNPSWVKPDWAFIEEGMGIPQNPADRVEEGVLGDYALGFGKGYFIHGTLYTRLLGKNVTHGCIRLNDQDLKAVYRFARIGTPIIIF